MRDTTTRAQFDALLDGHRVVPVIRELFADGETPVGIYRKLAGGAPGTFLLESAEQGGIWSRFSFVGVSSFGVLTQEGDSWRWIDAGLSEERALGTNVPVGPLDAVAHVHARWATPHVPGHPPLTGGLVGFIGWEAIRQIENLPDAPPADVIVPGQALSFVAELVVLDHRTGSVLLIAAALNDGQDTPDELWIRAQAGLDSMQRRLSQPAEAWIAEVDLTTPAEPRPRIAPADFEAAVTRSKQFIVDGDVFQVVLSQRFEVDTDVDALDVYRVLRTSNPSPYMYLLRFEGASSPYDVVGSSPEALVTVTGDRAVVHPPAGTRPRGATPAQDAELAEGLRQDPKERAEHVMLVDLARNDLGRVCVPGTVDVTDFMRVELYSHVMHLVSTVNGRLQPGARALDVLRATFPAGTVSGAPKPRAMEVIEALEPSRRSLYAGTVGYVDAGGDMDMAIAIRTAVLHQGVAYVQAGAGIVADSDPASEQAECENKAAAVLRALAAAATLRPA